MHWTLATLTLALSAPAGAFAAEAPACTATVKAEGALAAWGSEVAMTAGNDAAGAPAIKVGQAARLALRPGAAVRYAVTPAKAAGDGTFGGMVAIYIAKPGTYRVALGTAAWLDLAGPDGAVASTAHAHGAPCTGIRKMVDFSLKPGRYLVQVSGAGVDSAGLLVVAVEGVG